jgi:predicted ferric reductase
MGIPAIIMGTNLRFPLEPMMFFYALGKYFGFMAYFIFIFQYLWTAKVRIFERLVSFDRRVTIHRTLGFLGILTVSLHPILILGAYSLQGISLFISLPLGLGFAAFLILLVIAGSTFFGRIWGTRYETWKNFHWLTFSVLTLAFFHSFFLGSDIYGGFRFFWGALWGVHVIMMVLKLLHKKKKWSHYYKILEVRKERQGVTTIIAEKPDKSHYLPGQFGFLSIFANNKWQHWHPFSMTSNEKDPSVSMTIKAVGDFTQQIGELQAGNTVKLDIPYGGFSPDVAADVRYVMIAGGIGITPIYGILKDIAGRPQSQSVEIILLYSVHHESDILFRKDIERWFSKMPDWKLIFNVTSQPDWKGEKGRLTPQRVKSLLENDLSGTYFLCGPLPLIRSIRKFLISEGVSRKKIRHEQFVFLP